MNHVTALRAEFWSLGYRPAAICNPDSDPTRSPGKRPVGLAWETRARLDPPLARRVASVLAPLVRSGALSRDEARDTLPIAVRVHAPNHAFRDAVLRRLLYELDERVTEIEARVSRTIALVRRAVQPLIKRRAPLEEILRAADKENRGVLSQDEIVEICRDVFARTKRVTRGR